MVIIIINADEIKLKKLIDILLENAIKFTPDEGLLTLKLSVCKTRYRFLLLRRGLVLNQRIKIVSLKGLNRLTAPIHAGMAERVSDCRWQRC